MKTPSGYLQQSPRLTVANKQLELMARYMTEFGMTPASRSRIAAPDPRMGVEPLSVQIQYVSPDGTVRDAAPRRRDPDIVISGNDVNL